MRWTHLAALDFCRLEYPTISNMLAKACKVVGHFNHSTHATVELHKVQKRNNRDERSLVKDVATRWNSSYLMLDSQVNEKISVVAVLEDEAITAPHDYKRLKLSGMQWDLAEEMLKVLKPLQVATTALCEEVVLRSLPSTLL